jgi:serine/threonine protein kinase
MAAVLALFRFGAKAALNTIGCGIPIGDFVVEALPEIARDLWGRWGKGRSPQQLRDEVQAVAALSAAEVRQQVAEVVAQEAGNQPEPIRQALTGYLKQLPNAIRQSQRRMADPTGRTVSDLLSLRRPEDLIRLLPPRPPRFKVGDRPLQQADWVLEKLLGMGGFGEVWKARNPYLPQRVALKFCLDGQAARVLRNEAALLGRVMRQGQHRHIVPLLGTYLNAEPPCLEYEYVAGGDLTELLYKQLQKRQGKLPPDLVLKIVRSLARTMKHPHGLKPPIVHRDLKPANILVQRSAEGKLSFRIADFGIGGVAAGHAIEQARGTTTGHFLATALRGFHTPLYASPQQMEGAAPDPRDDVYALGVIWYQLLVGDLTKGAPSGRGWRHALTGRGVSASVLDLMEECFEGDAAHRITDAGVLAERLEDLLKPRPGTALVLPMHAIDPTPLAIPKVGSETEQLRASTPSGAVAVREVEVAVPGKWFARRANDPQAEWVPVRQTPRTVSVRSGEVYRLDPKQACFQGLYKYSKVSIAPVSLRGGFPATGRWLR